MIDDELKTTARALIEHCYLRVLLKLQKDRRGPAQLDEEQRSVLLGAWEPELLQDLAYAETLIEHARDAALSATNEALHANAEGLDDEMIDEATEYALGRG